MAVALRSFAELGYEGTTTAGVARAAQVTQPLVHHHFGSKEGLWRAAMDQLFSEVRLFTALDRSAPPTQALLDVVERFTKLSAARPELSRIISREGATPGPRLDYLMKHLRGQFDEIATALRREQRAGRIDPRIPAELLIFFVTGAAAHIFDVAALVHAAFGVDVAAPATQKAFITLVRSVIESGVVRPQGVASP